MEEMAEGDRTPHPLEVPISLHHLYDEPQGTNLGFNI